MNAENISALKLRSTVKESIDKHLESECINSNHVDFIYSIGGCDNVFIAGRYPLSDRFLIISYREIDIVNNMISINYINNIIDDALKLNVLVKEYNRIIECRDAKKDFKRELLVIQSFKYKSFICLSMTREEQNTLLKSIVDNDSIGNLFIN